MGEYQKPIVVTNDELAEGVYAASGAVSDGDGNGGIKCDSIYMKGVWQAGDYSQWTAEENAAGGRGYRKTFGCLGCPANTANGCGLQTHYIDSGEAASYEVDNGNRKPTWEKKGYGPNDPVSDWSCG